MQYENILTDITNEIAQAPEGSRNNTLFRLAAKALRYAVSGHLDESQVLHELTDAALTAGLEMAEIEQTLESARSAAQQGNGHQSFMPAPSGPARRTGAQAAPAIWPAEAISAISTAVASLLDSGELPAVLTQRGFQPTDLEHTEFFLHGKDVAIVIRDARGHLSALKIRRTSPTASGRYQYLTHLNGLPLPAAHNRAWHSPDFGKDSGRPVLVMEGELNAMAAWLALGGGVDAVGMAGTNGKLAWSNLYSRRLIIYADGDEAGQLAVTRWIEQAQRAKVSSATAIPAWYDDDGNTVDACDIVASLGRAELRGRLTDALNHEPTESDLVPTRPQIVVKGRQVYEVAGECLEVLKSGPYAFTRNSKIVLASPDHVLTEADKSSLTSRLEAHADFVNEEGRPHQLGQRPVEFILNENATQLPRIDYFIQYPALLPDASIPKQPGYYPQHRTLVRKSDVQRVDFTTEEATAYLQYLFIDFPFADREAAFAAILSTLISHLAMAFIVGPRPMLVVDAFGAGQGKTYIAQIIAIILTGAGPVTDVPERTEELQKTLPSFLTVAAPVVILDNAVNLDLGPLKPLLTSTKMNARPLGATDVSELDNNTTWVATGLNLQLGPEMHRRVVPIQLSSELERSELKSGFQIAEILKWTAANRSELLSAVLVIIQNWLDVGRPAYSGPHRLGSFERYVSIVGGILEAAHIPGFLEGRDYMRHDPFADAMVLWLDQVHHLFPAPDKNLAAADFVDAASGFERELERKLRINVRSTRAVGWFLRKRVGHPYGRYKLVDGPSNDNGNHGYKLIVDR